MSTWPDIASHRVCPGTDSAGRRLRVWLWRAVLGDAAKVTAVDISEDAIPMRGRISPARASDSAASCKPCRRRTDRLRLITLLGDRTSERGPGALRGPGAWTPRAFCSFRLPTIVHRNQSRAGRNRSIATEFEYAEFEAALTQSSRTSASGPRIARGHAFGRRTRRHQPRCRGHPAPKRRTLRGRLQRLGPSSE